MIEKNNVGKNANEEMIKGTMNYVSSFNMYYENVRKIGYNHQVAATEGNS